MKIYSRSQKHSKESISKNIRLAELIKEKSKLNMTDEFAQYSKLERQIKKLENEIILNTSHSPNNYFSVRLFLSMLLKSLEAVVFMIFVYNVRKCSLSVIPENSLSLLPNWLHNDILIKQPLWMVLPLWAALCRTIISSVIDFFVSE